MEGWRGAVTIRKRIFRSNTRMVLAALLILLTIGMLLIVLFKNEFMSWYGRSIELSDKHYEVYDYLNKMNTDKLYNENIQGVADDLGAMGFQLYVCSVSEVLYSNMKYGNEEAIESLALQDKEYGQIVTAHTGGVTILAVKYLIQGADYEMYAASSSTDVIFPGIELGMFETFLTVFLIIGVFSIGGILLCSQLFTKLLIRKIMEPVDELNRAANRVRDGVLDVPINYEMDDEFKDMCDSFDLMQAHLKQELEQNKAYEMSRTQMVSGISHDLRTPLTSVKGYIKGVLDGVASTDEKRTEYLKIAYKKSCDMDVLLSKLFYFSKLETGNMPFFMQKLDMAEFIRSYAEGKRSELWQKKAVLNLEFLTEKGMICNIDREQFTRVLDNMVENSLKYSGVADGLILKLKLSEKDGYVEFDFSDNGNGVPEDKLTRIFEQFYRVDESRKSDGNGLGLYICKYIIKGHDGKIRAYNDNGFHIAIELQKLEV